MSTFLQRFRSSLLSRGFTRALTVSAGFTLTELMVVITIMTLLTGVFLFQQRQFDSTTLLRSLAYSVALSIREAQTYGTSVRSFETGMTTEFPAYGVYFDVTNDDEYILFADVNDNGQYDAGEVVDNYTFQGNYSISDICATDGSELCGITWMAVTFRRPNPDACIATSDPNMDDVCGASPSSPSPYSQGLVQIEGSGGVTRSVTVTPSGQIAVGTVGS
ncbi:MAG: prepilin-type N-terminal cleavage/methylation domain-containing protein [Candidatus Adlerbacteria bacterium]|nr:prepilin-type N-terminal cleavage/methylation domain-containing protein [Candidatus Adlerbacteria bacterium]